MTPRICCGRLPAIRFYLFFKLQKEKHQLKQNKWQQQHKRRKKQERPDHHYYSLNSMHDPCTKRSAEKCEKDSRRAAMGTKNWT
jgi:hypothetical protein